MPVFNIIVGMRAEKQFFVKAEDMGQGYLALQRHLEQNPSQYPEIKAAFKGYELDESHILVMRLDVDATKEETDAS